MYPAAQTPATGDTGRGLVELICTERKSNLQALCQHGSLMPWSQSTPSNIKPAVPTAGFLQLALSGEEASHWTAGPPRGLYSQIALEKLNPRFPHSP